MWPLRKKPICKRFVIWLLILTLFGSICFIWSSKNQRHQRYTAIVLVESFGWKIDETRNIERDILGKQSFYEQYYWSLGKDPYWPNEEAGNGNISGICPEFFQKGYFGLDNVERNIVRFRIPLQYDMPDGTALEAWIAFYEDTLCETSIHAIKWSPDSPEESTGFLDYGTICPLNADRKMVEAWKSHHGKR